MSQDRKLDRKEHKRVFKTWAEHVQRPSSERAHDTPGELKEDFMSILPEVHWGSYKLLRPLKFLSLKT